MMLPTKPSRVVLESGCKLQMRRDAFFSAAGHLRLTNSELRFTPNWTNLGLAPEVVIDLTEIGSVTATRPLLLGIVPSFWANALQVRAPDGKVICVVRLSNSDRWQAAIDAARKEANLGPSSPSDEHG